MSLAQAAAGADRLPWLEDEPLPARRRSSRNVAIWGVAATALLASVSYWFGVHSSREPQSSAPKTQTTVLLPRARTVEQPQQQPQVATDPLPQVRMEPLPQLAIPTQRAERRTRPVANRKASPSGVSEAAKPIRPVAHPQQAVKPAKITPAVANPPLKAWPAWQSRGASGRLVRIGAFGSRTQAKLGWRAMVRSYPAVAHLQARVVETRNSRGRHFYRFQIGTTSQAHSEVLCQRMQKIRFSCAVVGLPWKPGGVER